ncbi:hypothetical protein GQ53DRAFT_103906 [Thozetella sp. PMI_491]|nr:hypothetical protein GQ53DRAFT_103906 [Thozetella sp. PMI_491]
MNGHAPSKHSLSYEESTVLLDEKSLSDVDSDAGRADVESRFSRSGRIWKSAAQACVSSLRSVSWRALAFRTGFFLLPSFVQSRISRDPRIRGGGDRLGPTAYLDGMRGLAALFVFFCHYFYTCFIIAQSYGYGEHNYHLLKLPFLRLFYQGPPMVCVFFVISGYALSLKPLKLIRARNFEGFAATMTSFTFRRGFRLFLPTAVSTLMIIFLLRIGLYEWTREFAYDSRYMKNVQETHYQRFETAEEQLRDWAGAMFNFVHIWGWEKYGGSTAIDVHLWTIPVEFRSSMMLFVTLIGTARLKTWLRFTFVGLIMWFTYRSDRWEMMLFYAGMVLAEVDLIRGAHTNPATTAALPVFEQHGHSSLLSQEHPPASPSRRARVKNFGWIGLSILALYFMSQPDQGGEATPGWVFLTSLVPEYWSDKYRYWQSIGSILFVLAVSRTPGWQRFFNTPLVQYFGKISYAIYLMHGPVMHTVGYAIERAAWGITGIQGENYNWGFILASFFVVPIVIWVSDIFWRAVDAPVVRFAKWFEARCSISD